MYRFQLLFSLYSFLCKGVLPEKGRKKTPHKRLGSEAGNWKYLEWTLPVNTEISNQIWSLEPLRNLTAVSLFIVAFIVNPPFVRVDSCKQSCSCFMASLYAGKIGFVNMRKWQNKNAL